MSNMDMMSSGVESLIEVTNALCVFVEDNELDSIPTMLETREQLLNEQLKLVEIWVSSIPDNHSQKELHAQLSSKLELLKQLDKKFVTLFSAKKDIVAEKFKQAQNEKLLLAYSR